MKAREWMEKHHPEKVDPTEKGGFKGCPSDYDELGLEDPPRCGNCEDCWDREVTEVEDKTQKLTVQIDELMKMRAAIEAENRQLQRDNENYEARIGEMEVNGAYNKGFHAGVKMVYEMLCRKKFV